MTWLALFPSVFVLHGSNRFLIHIDLGLSCFENPLWWFILLPIVWLHCKNIGLHFHAKLWKPLEEQKDPKIQEEPPLIFSVCVCLRMFVHVSWNTPTVIIYNQNYHPLVDGISDTVFFLSLSFTFEKQHLSLLEHLSAHCQLLFWSLIDFSTFYLRKKESAGHREMCTCQVGAMPP